MKYYQKEDWERDLQHTRSELLALSEELGSELHHKLDHYREKLLRLKERLDLSAVYQKHPLATLTASLAAGYALNHSLNGKRQLTVTSDYMKNVTGGQTMMREMKRLRREVEGLVKRSELLGKPSGGPFRSLMHNPEVMGLVVSLGSALFAGLARRKR